MGTRFWTSSSSPVATFVLNSVELENLEFVDFWLATHQYVQSQERIVLENLQGPGSYSCLAQFVEFSKGSLRSAMCEANDKCTGLILFSK